jgi:hypothetical protein
MAAVAASKVPRRRVQDQNACPGRARTDGGAQPSVATADHQHVIHTLGIHPSIRKGVFQ